MNIENLNKEIRKLAVRAVLEGEGSHSSYANFATGPRYQRIGVPEATYDGFRDTTRDRLIEQLDLKNKVCLDLGCNMGETSRFIMHQGAKSVTGIEYEPYFIAVGNLVNAAYGIENVRFYRRDITEPGFLRGLGKFDYTFVLSSYNYVRQNLHEVIGATKTALVLETHRALPGCYALHLKEIGPYFKYNRILGFTDHGRGSSDHRLFVVFSNDGDLISKLPRYDEHYQIKDAYLDLNKTNFSYLKTFFNIHSAKEPIKAFSNDFQRGITGALYWEKLLIGYQQWLNDVPWNETDYYKHLEFLHKMVYPGGEILEVQHRHRYIIERRYETFSRAENGSEPEYDVLVRVLNRPGEYIFDIGSFHIAPNDGVRPPFDGIHRCFMYKYLGFDKIPALVTIET